VRAHYEANAFGKHPCEQGFSRQINRSHLAEINLYRFTGIVLAPALFEFLDLICSQIATNNEAGSSSVGKRLDGQHVHFSVKSRPPNVGDLDHVNDPVQASTHAGH
jgi:hypothetical protein